MKETEALIQLQDIDVKLIRIPKLLNELPQKQLRSHKRTELKSIQRHILTLKGQLSDLKLDSEDNRVQYRKLEGHVTDAQAKQEENSADYKSIRDFEYQLSHLAKCLEKLDFELKQINESKARIEAELHIFERKCEQLELEIEKISQDLMQRVAKTKSALDLLKKQREKLCAFISEEVLADYEKLSSRFGGLCVEKLENNVPSVCRVKLQPAQYSEIKKGKEQITHCPYCRRILVLE